MTVLGTRPAIGLALLAASLLWFPALVPAGECPTDLELEVVRLLNAERAEAGLSPLAPEVRLTEASRRHSEAMASLGFFSHTGADGSTFSDRFVDAGYPLRAGGEDIAAGYPTPAAVVEGWMASAGHRAIILTAGYRDVGVGYAPGGPYGHYWTADFGLSSDAGQPPGEACAAGERPTAPASVRLVRVVP